MKYTLSTSQVADILRKDSNADWSRAGALAMAEFLESYESDCGEEIELDIVAIRCEWSEHSSLQDWAEDYFGKGWRDELFIDESEDDDDMIDKAIKAYIEDRGTLIEFSGGIIVSNF